MCCSGTSSWGFHSCFHQHISAWLHSEKQTKRKEWSTNQKTSVQLRWNPALVSRTLCSTRAQQSKQDWRKAASMMNVLEQFPCKEGLSKLVLLSLEIRHAGGSSSLGNSLPKDAISAKSLLEFKSRLNKYLQGRSFGDSLTGKQQQAQKITWAENSGKQEYLLRFFQSTGRFSHYN